MINDLALGDKQLEAGSLMVPLEMAWMTEPKYRHLEVAVYLENIRTLVTL